MLASAAILGLLLGPESAHYLAWRAESLPAAGQRCAVLVLGYPSRNDGSPSAVQRLRVEAGAHVLRAQGCDTLILSGGNPHSGPVEAEAMARVALELGLPEAGIIKETRARSTWENIEYSLPLLERFPRIFVVSDGLHARRAKGYLCRQRPDLCPKTHATTRYEPFRHFWYKWAAAFYNAKALSFRAP